MHRIIYTQPKHRWEDHPVGPFNEDGNVLRFWCPNCGAEVGAIESNDGTDPDLSDVDPFCW